MSSEELDSCMRRNDREKALDSCMRRNDREKALDSCMRRNDRHRIVIPDVAPAEFRNFSLILSFRRHEKSSEGALIGNSSDDEEIIG